jgi:integrase/recombinase XerD
MLSVHVERYVSLRQTLGFALHDASADLRAFARFAAARGDTHLRSSTAVDWAEEAPSPNARHIRLREVVQLARFLHAEDPIHDVPSSTFFHAPKVLPPRRSPRSSTRPAGFDARTLSDARCMRRCSG